MGGADQPEVGRVGGAVGAVNSIDLPGTITFSHLAVKK